MLRGRLHRLLRCRSGAAAVEFALVAPIFLLILFGILVYGQYLSLVHSMEQLAAQSARRSLAGLDTAERTSLALNYLNANARYYPLVDPSRLTVTAAPAPGDADIFVVTLDYDLRGTLFDVFPEFLPPRRTLSESAAIERGGY